MQVEALMLVHVYVLFPQHAAGLRLGPGRAGARRNGDGLPHALRPDRIAVSITLPRIKATAAGGRTSDDP